MKRIFKLQNILWIIIAVVLLVSACSSDAYFAGQYADTAMWKGIFYSGLIDMRSGKSNTVHTDLLLPDRK